MSESCTHECSNCSVGNCGERTSPSDFVEKLNELSHVNKVIGVVSGKGGVGKSLVTSMMAVLMNRRGYHTAVLDADITGPSIPKVFGINERAKGGQLGDKYLIYPEKTKTGIDVMSVNLLLENVTDPVVWRGPIIAGTVKQFWTDVLWDNVDFMFVDMPPGTGDVPLTVFQSIPLDGILVVASPQDLVSMIVAKAVNMAKMMNIPILGLIENMSYVECPDCGKKISLFGESRMEEVGKEYGVEVLGKLPVDPKLAKACDAGAIELFEGNWLDGTADIIEQMK